MNRDKVLELAREAELARQLALEVPFVVDRLERFAALIEREVRGDAKPVAWIITRKTAKNGLKKSAVLGSYNWASAHCDVGSPEPLYSHSVSVNAEIVGTVKELFTNSALERLDLRPSTKVYIAPPTPAPAVGAEPVARLRFYKGEVVVTKDYETVERNGEFDVYTHPSPAVDAKPVAWQYYDKELGKWFASEAPLSVRKEFEAEGYKTEDLFEIRTPSTKKKKI